MAQLAAPIVLAEIGWMTMGIVDTIMVGRLPASAESIAAVALGTILFYTAGTFGGGLLLGLDTLVSQSFGAGNRADCHRSLVNALYLSAPIAAALMAVLWRIQPLLGMLGERPEVMRLMTPYLSTLTWSIAPLLLYFGLRRYLQAVGVVWPVMLAPLAANLVNLIGNYVFVYGKFGAPALGVSGSAWATLISRVFMASVLLVALLATEPRSSRWPGRPDVRRMRRLLALGFPAGAQILIETGIFALAAVFIGRIDSVSLAAHQVALNAAAFTFMVPLGVGSAGAVRVGHALGRRDKKAAGTSGWAALALGVGFMSLAAIVFLALPGSLARIYTQDLTVIQLSVSLLAIAAAFQIFDGAQAVLSGVLRGAGDTRTPMLTHLVGYWLIGIPVAYLLCFRLGWGAVGVWAGMLGGLMFIGTVLFFFWMRTVRQWKHPARDV